MNGFCSAAVFRNITNKPIIISDTKQEIHQALTQTWFRHTTRNNRWTEFYDGGITMNTMQIDAMQQVLNSMENKIILRSQAKAERRAEEAQQQKRAFEEKLMRAAADKNKIELEGMASQLKGSQDAVQRDQLVGMMMNAATIS